MWLRLADEFPVAPHGSVSSIGDEPNEAGQVPSAGRGDADDHRTSVVLGLPASYQLKDDERARGPRRRRNGSAGARLAPSEEG